MSKRGYGEPLGPQSCDRALLPAQLKETIQLSTESSEDRNDFQVSVEESLQSDDVTEGVKQAAACPEVWAPASRCDLQTAFFANVNVSVHSCSFIKITLDVRPHGTHST